MIILQLVMLAIYGGILFLGYKTYTKAKELVRKVDETYDYVIRKSSEEPKKPGGLNG